MSNRFTKYTADKLRADGWLDKEQADHLRTQLKSVEADAAVKAKALAQAKEALESVTEEIEDMAGLLVESDEQEDSTIGKAWKALLKRVAFPAIASITEALATNAGKPLLERLKEAEWIIRNSVATDTFAATRRDAFLNPKPQDVM